MVKKAISDSIYMLSLIHKKNKWFIPLKILIIIIDCLKLLINTLYIKFIVDAMISKTIDDVFIIVTIIQISFFILSLLINLLEKRVLERMQFKIQNELQNDFIKQATKHDLQCYEDYDFYNSFTKAMRVADNKAISILNNITSLISSVFSIILLGSVIGVLDYVLMFFIVIMIISSSIDTILSNHVSMELYDASEIINRQAEYLKRVAHHHDFAKEVRAYNLFDFLRKKLNVAFNEKFKMFKITNKKYWNIKLIFSIINSLIISTTLLLYLAYMTMNGHFTIGEFTMLFGAVFTLAGYMANIINVFSNLNFESKYYISNLRKILDYQPKIENSGTLSIDSTKQHTIEFKNVSFTYPNSNNKAINNVSFKINVNEKVAIVGRNGSGKSTIIKLLLRLYDVDSGEILLDNINIKEYNVYDLRACFSTIFQDYKIYAFTIAENIMLNENINSSLIDESLKYVDLYDKIQSCKFQANTYVTKEFDENGVNFSGGELQKIAIARAYVNNCSTMILDEANSALDPIADYEMTTKMINQMNDKMVIFVSHRLNSIVNVEKILVFKDGVLVESGKHEELLKNKSLYYEMYSRQKNAMESYEMLKAYE